MIRFSAYALLAVSCAALPCDVFAQEVAPTQSASRPVVTRADFDPCRSAHANALEVLAQQSFNSFGDIDVSISSISGAQRICLNGDLVASAEGAFDYVNTDGRSTTAGRVGASLLQFVARQDPYADPRGVGYSVGLGVRGFVGYEDYDLTLYDRNGVAQQYQGSRASRSIGVFGSAVLFNRGDELDFPAPHDAVRLDIGVTYSDRRAPSAALPISIARQVTQTQVDVAYDMFFDHHPFGSYVRFGAGHDRYYGPSLSNNGITRLFLQWRPQGNPNLDYPDRFSFQMLYAFGQNFAGLTISIGKVF